MRDFKGRVAFITGGSSGIGLAIAKTLAGEGMKIAFTYRREDHLQQAMAFLSSIPGCELLPIKLDVVDRAGMQRAAELVAQKLGTVQVLVNNAGVGVRGPLVQATYDDWDWVMGVNVGGVINGIVTFLPRMIESGLEGHIVNISSMGGIAAFGSVGIYTTSKFAVTGLSEALRNDLRDSRIGVSVYCPGPVSSNIVEAIKSRPTQLSETGYPAPDRIPDKPPLSMSPHAMTADQAAGYVLEGIRENRLFILSHPEYRALIESRHAALEQALPDEPINEARYAAMQWNLSTAIYSEGA